MADVPASRLASSTFVRANGTGSVSLAVVYVSSGVGVGLGVGVAASATAATSDVRVFRALPEATAPPATNRARATLAPMTMLRGRANAVTRAVDGGDDLRRR